MDGNKMNGLLQRQNLRASQKPFAAMEMARMECRIPLQATVECVHASSLSPTLMSECASCFFTHVTTNSKWPAFLTCHVHQPFLAVANHASSQPLT